MLLTPLMQFGTSTMVLTYLLRALLASYRTLRDECLSKLMTMFFSRVFQAGVCAIPAYSDFVILVLRIIQSDSYHFVARETFAR